jgi:hypothetical protein
LHRATEEGRLRWSVGYSDGAHFGDFQVTAKNHEFLAQYRCGRKGTVNDISIRIGTGWVSLAFEDEPVAALLDLLRKQELELLVEDIVAGARSRAQEAQRASP